MIGPPPAFPDPGLSPLFRQSDCGMGGNGAFHNPDQSGGWGGTNMVSGVTAYPVVQTYQPSSLDLMSRYHIPEPIVPAHEPVVFVQPKIELIDPEPIAWWRPDVKPRIDSFANDFSHVPGLLPSCGDDLCHLEDVSCHISEWLIHKPLLDPLWALKLDSY